jgi:hypothetical protein
MLGLFQTPMRSPLSLLLGFVTLAACAPDANRRPDALTSPPAGADFNTTSVTKPATGPWARIVEGKIGPGALYALYIPRTWNGDVVYFVHGVKNVGLPVDLQDDPFPGLRDFLGAQGFAGAYSSWSENGMAVKDAAIRVHQLRGILTAELPTPPSRSFLVSSSLGGAPALDLLESYPGQYDGALLLCGMVGGVQLELRYTANVRLLFDAFYPGALPGSFISDPPTPPLTPATGGCGGSIQPNAALRHREPRADSTTVRPVGKRAQSDVDGIPDARRIAFRSALASIAIRRQRG